MSIEIPNDVVELWPENFLTPEQVVDDLKRLKESGGSSPSIEVELTDGRRLGIELPFYQEELIIRELVVEPEPEVS